MTVVVVTIIIIWLPYIIYYMPGTVLMLTTALEGIILTQQWKKLKLREVDTATWLTSGKAGIRTQIVVDVPQHLTLTVLLQAGESNQGTPTPRNESSGYIYLSNNVWALLGEGPWLDLSKYPTSLTLTPRVL